MRFLLTPIRREILLIALVSLSVTATPHLTSRHEAADEGFLLRKSVQTIGGLYPAKSKLQLYYSKFPSNSDSFAPEWKALSPSPNHILIHCTDEPPADLMNDGAAFSTWMRANCEFAPAQKP